MLSWEGPQDAGYNVHAASFIRISDNMQGPIYPKITKDIAIASWHNICMPDIPFDLDAVRSAMREQKVTQAALAEVVGLTSQSAMSNILKGKRGVSVQEAQKIYSRLQLNAPERSGIQLVPIIGLTSAGNWREAIEMPIGQLPLPRNVASKRSFALEVIGDSMNLLIEDGGFVVVDPERKVLQDGKCYLIQNGDHEATVKCYRKNPARFVPMSDNPEHKEFLASDRDFVIMGRIVWKGSPL